MDNSENHPNHKRQPPRWFQWLWGAPLASLSPGRRALQRTLRVLYVVGRDLADGQLTLRAMSLVYTTLLSLVPFLAVTFSVLKGFGAHNKVEPFLLNLLAPLGDKGTEITQTIIQFVDNVKVGVLGSLGVVFLLYTVVSLVQKVEKAFNFTWHVTQSRPLAQRFSDYLSVIFVGPLLIFTALGLTATITSAMAIQSLQDIPIISTIVTYVGKSVPYILVILAFSFVYLLIPNTKVKFSSAIVGGVVSGVLWESSGWLFASFLLNSAKYIAIYSAFASLIFFLIWLYLSWMILLIGSSIAFYVQNPDYIQARREVAHMSNRMEEWLAIELMSRIYSNFHKSDSGVTIDKLMYSIQIPKANVEKVMEILEKGGFVVRVINADTRYFPARAAEQVSVRQVLDHVRSHDELPGLFERLSGQNSRIRRLVYGMETENNVEAEDITFRALIE